MSPSPFTYAYGTRTGLADLTAEVVDIILSFAAALLLEIFHSNKIAYISKDRHAIPAIDTALPESLEVPRTIGEVKVSPALSETLPSSKRKRVSWSENIEVIDAAPDQAEDTSPVRPKLKVNTSFASRASILFSPSAFKYPSLPSPSTRRRRHSCSAVVSPRASTPKVPHPIAGTRVGLPIEHTQMSPTDSKRHTLDGAWSSFKHAVASMSHRKSSSISGPIKNSPSKLKLTLAKPIHVRDLFAASS